MLRDGFLRFCNDPEIACCKAEAELGRLRTENAQLRSQLQEAQRRERAAVEMLQTIDWVGSGAKRRIEDAIEALMERGPVAGKGNGNEKGL